jgi:hypothetical protein
MKNLLPILALCAALSACGDSAGDVGGDDAASTATISVELVDMAGLERALAARRGRPLVLNFWAMW